MSITDIFQDIIESPYGISSAFDFIKGIFGELYLLILSASFFLTYVLFILVTVGLFVVLPLYLIRQVNDNKKLIKKFITLDFQFFK